MTDTPLYEDLRSMLAGDGRVAALLKRSSSAHITWDRFLAMRLPSEMSPTATWELLKLLNRAVGLEIPIPDLSGADYWYLRTHEIADSISRIQCLCRADSDLYRKLMATQNRRVLVRSRIDETIAAAQLDGLDIAIDETYDMLHLERMPRSDNERLVMNTLTAIDHLDELVNERFSKELFYHLRDLVLEGVDPTQLKHTKARMGIITFDYRSAEVSEHADEQFRYIAEYANHATGDVHDHAIFRGLLLPDLLRLYRPLPDANSQVGRLAFRLYTLKTGLPVLGMLPLSRAKLQWEEGTLQSSLVTLDLAEYSANRELQGTDLTDYATLSLQLALAALQDLYWNLLRLERRDEELRSLLQRDPEINHRQRSVLGRALRNPNAEFRIAYHKTTHNVVYATARADLLELAEKGYLLLDKQGRAMVFTPRPGLREYIESGYSTED